MAKIIIFGTGDIAQIANYYFETDSEHDVVAFTVDKAYVDGLTFESKPLVAFENLMETYPPSDYKMFIALSYSKMNKIREDKYHQSKTLGYELVSYVSSKCSYFSQFQHGDNCFIFEDNTIQPFVELGNNITLWSGNHIGHHSKIEDHNFISSHVVISGHCTIKSNCFLGVNATIAHKVVVAEETLVGAGAVISKHTERGGIYVPPRTVKLNKTSNQVDM